MPSEESPEEKFDRLKKKLQDSILRDYPNPERKGCLGGAVVQNLAERPLDEPVDGDPCWHHVTHCSECYGEFLAFKETFRQRAQVRRAQVGWGLAIAALALFVGVPLAVRPGSIFTERPQNAELAWTKRTVVVPSMVRSGEASDQKPIFLDRLPLELTVELPVGSKAGSYELELAMNHRAAVSTGGTAEIYNGTTAFTVRINLSGFEAGNYSMVIRQVPNDWNLYPVVIR